MLNGSSNDPSACFASASFGLNGDFSFTRKIFGEFKLTAIEEKLDCVRLEKLL